MTNSATSTSTTTIPSTQRVYDAVAELRALEQTATRETVAELTGLKLSIVDDRLGALVDDGRLKRVLRGVYEMVETFPPARAISQTVIPGGWVKLEVGDDVLTLTPRECRAVARMLSGAAEDARVIESTNQHMVLATELAGRVQKLERTIRSLAAARGLDGQLDLLTAD